MSDTMQCGVVGAGLMGREIALVFALAGHRVRLHDRTTEALDAALDRLQAIIDKGIARNLFAEADRAALDRITPTTDLADFGDCDFVTEAVFEREDVKAEVFAALDRHCKPGCVIATNTSTIPITVLASYVSEARRAQFIGTHYFSPVSRMKLVEVIPGHFTAPEVLKQTLEICAALGKKPVPIKDVTGFAVNRLLHVLMIEAVRLVEEGVATPEDIDTACKLGLGHPMGPFELMDATTSSLCLQAQEIMHDAYGERFRPRPLLKARVRAGLVGGRGRPGWRQA
ncbi:MAG: 3-hydroxyacyl-CoA dehydrogenase family protein [Pararhodobacter sp.]